MSSDDLDTPTTTLEKYCKKLVDSPLVFDTETDLVCVLRDLEFIKNLKRVYLEGQLDEKKYREQRFGAYLKAEDGSAARFANDYVTFRKPNLVHSDRLMEFLSRNLPKRLAWSRSERLIRRAAFDADGKPLEFSLETRFITCVFITILAAARLITPIVLMTIP